MGAYLALDVIVEQNKVMIEQMDRLVKISEMHYASQRRVESRYMMLRLIYGLIVILLLLTASWFSYNYYQKNKNKLSSIDIEKITTFVTKKSQEGIQAVHSLIEEPVDEVINEIIGGNYKPFYSSYASDKYNDSEEALGSLSAKYESHGYYGIIGKDSTGGWSYGKYQIATKTGTMRYFLFWLKKHDKESFDALSIQGGEKAAYKAKKGFVRMWRELSKNKRFQKSQHDFIRDTHYLVLVNNILSDGIDVSHRSMAFKNVLWSVAVQHGGGYGKNNSGGAAIIRRVFKKVGKSASDKEAIDYLYKIRGNYFGSSSSKVQEAVNERFRQEYKEAISSLNR